MIVYICLILWEALFAPYLVMPIRQLFRRTELTAELLEAETIEALNEDDEGEKEVSESLKELRETSTSQSVSCLNENTALHEERVIEVVNAATEKDNSELNNSKVHNDTIASATRSVLIETVFRRSLECHYGLLDHLLQSECLTVEDIRYLKDFNSERQLVNKLLEFINSSNINKFLQGLEESNQSHLANFIRKNGGREPPEDTEWPVSDCELAPIIKSYPDLTQHIYNNNLVDQLFAKKCLSCEQKNSVLSKATNEEKNRKLLEIMMRRSVRQLDIFFNCLGVDNPEIRNQLHAQGDGVFAVDLDVEADNLAQYLDEFREKKQEILRQADDPALEVDLVEVDDRIYMVAKAKVGEKMEGETITPSSQSAKVLVDNVQKKIKEVLGNNYKNAANIESAKALISEEIDSGMSEYEFSHTSPEMARIILPIPFSKSAPPLS